MHSLLLAHLYPVLLFVLFATAATQSQAPPSRPSLTTIRARVSDGSVSTVEDTDVVYGVSAAFGLSEFNIVSDVQMVYQKSVCTDNDDTPMGAFALLTERPTCSHEHMARLAQEKNATALIVINEEYEFGQLYPLLPELTYYTAPSSRTIHIPVVLITRTDGDVLKRALLTAQLLNITNNVNSRLNTTSTNNNTHNSTYVATVGIFAATEHNRSLIHAWNAYIVMYACLFGITTILAVVSLGWVIRSNSVNDIVKLSLAITLVCALLHTLDLLLDHWNMRGLTSRAGFQVLYWIEIDAMVHMYAMTQWLWYRVLDEKDLVKYKALVVKKHMVVAIVLVIFSAGLLRVILVAVGQTIVVAFRVWNPIITMIFWTLSGAMVFNGVRLKTKVKKMMHKAGSTYKLTVMMIVGNVVFISAGISLFWWIIAPSTFGVWSWFIFNFLWRLLTLILCLLFLFVYGTRIVDKQADSPSLQDTKSTASVRMSVASGSGSSGDDGVELP